MGTSLPPSSPPSLAGKLLIAMPGLQEPSFKRSVILICAHTHEHAMGLILNRKMKELTLTELMPQLGITGTANANIPILAGGPVRRDRGFVLHSEDFDSAGATVTVIDGVCLTANKDVLDAMASDMPPEHAVLALGYAGWGAGQLDDEIAGNVWLVAEPEMDIVFDQSHDTKWARALHSLGVSPDQLHFRGGCA